MVKVVHIDLANLDTELVNECSGWVVPFPGEKREEVVSERISEGSVLSSVRTLKRWVKEREVE